MGLIITELKERKPDLVYFDHEYTGEYPKEAPFTISELEEIYPCASGKAKVDEEFAKRAHDATVMLQNKDRGYTAIWNHILKVSIEDLQKTTASWTFILICGRKRVMRSRIFRTWFRC